MTTDTPAITRQRSKFHPRRIARFVENAKQRVGGYGAWSFVGQSIREMAIEAEAFNIYHNQDESLRFGSEDLHMLLMDMRREAFGE